jgi:hypothetical protein
MSTGAFKAAGLKSTFHFLKPLQILFTAVFLFPQAAETRGEWYPEWSYQSSNCPKIIEEF